MKNFSKKIDLSKKIDRLNFIRLAKKYPDHFVYHRCPKGCMRGVTQADIFRMKCSKCKSELEILGISKNIEDRRLGKIARLEIKQIWGGRKRKKLKNLVVVERL